jgi:hypothetical protein
MLFLQDNVRNQLIQFELLLTTATFVVAIFGVVSGVFGMNFEGVGVFTVPHAFEWTLGITGVWRGHIRLSPLVLQEEKVLPLVNGFLQPSPASCIK